MAERGTHLSESVESPAERKLRRIVRLLARAEARGWLASGAANDPASADGTSAAGTNSHPPEEDNHAD